MREVENLHYGDGQIAQELDLARLAADEQAA